MADNAGRLGHKLRNFEAYRKEGYDDRLIIDRLVETGDLPQRNLDAYRRAGKSDEAILHYLVTGQEMEVGAHPLRAFNRGAAVGLSDIAGAPSDIAEMVPAGVNKLRQSLTPGSPFFEANPPPVDIPGGSDFFRRQLNRIGGENFAYESLEDLPRSDKPLAAAGEVVGANIAAAVPVAGAARAGMLGKVGQVLRRDPKTALTVEGLSVGGAAQGAFIGEALNPGGPGRFVGEVAGGFLNPTGLLLRGVRGLKNSVMDWAKTLTKSGTQDRVAKLILGAMEEAGENPGEIASLLRKEGLIAKDVRTAGMATDSPTLAGLESKLIKESAKFGGEWAARARQTNEDLQALIEALSKSSNPDALRMAAQLREQRIGLLLDRRFSVAKAKVSVARGKFPDERNMTGASSEAYKILDDSLADARNIERTEYWGKVDKNVPIEDASAITAKYKDLQSRRLKVESDKLPVLVREQNARIKRLLSGDEEELAKGPLDSGELITFRSRMLAEARSARSKGEWGDANVYSEVADSILEDLGKVDAAGYEQARDFSRKLNETFSQTFAGDALALAKEGGERISPELMLSRAFAGGKEGGDVKLRQLERAANFSNKSMVEQQEDFLRSAALFSRKDGVFNPQRLQTFIENNTATLKRFPQLQSDLSDARKAEAILAGWEKSPRVTQLTRQRTALQSLVGNEDPTVVIGKAFAGDTPQKSYRELAVMSKRAGIEARNGLKAATLDWAYNKSIDPQTGLVNWTKYRRFLTQPVSNRGPSPLEIMKRQEVISAGSSVRVQKILSEVSKLETSFKAGTLTHEADVGDAMFDLAVRIFGAQAAGLSSVGKVSGSGIVIAGAGSRFARNLFEKVPITKMRDVMIEASNNRTIMADLLQRNLPPARKKQVEKRIRLWLISSGFTAPGKIPESTEQPVEQPTKRQFTPAFDLAQ